MDCNPDSGPCRRQRGGSRWLPSRVAHPRAAYAASRVRAARSLRTLHRPARSPAAQPARRPIDHLPYNIVMNPDYFYQEKYKH